MKFLHPGPNAGNTFVPGSSRRRRERLRALEAQRAAGAQELPRFDHDWWGAPGRILAVEPCDAVVYADAPSPGALRILSGCGYDPGNAAVRHHTAINEHTKHADTFVRYINPTNNPFGSPTQIEGLSANRGVCYKTRALMEQADAIHSHMDYMVQWKAYNRGNMWRARPDQLVIRHYHGTLWNKPAKDQHPIKGMMEDDIAGVTLVGARLTLCALRPSRMQWLPIAIPVRRYAALRAKARNPGPFRIAHSPSRRDYKGSADLVAAVETLRKKRLAIDLVMIEKKQHGEALAMKATCDLTFDSFWLGLQGSGLEAAAMGQMVVAGDADVRELYKESEVGHCPYTFAGDRAELTAVLERAIVDEKWRKAETKRVNKYVVAYHDYPSVAARYESILAKAMGRTDVITEKRGAAA